MSAPYYLPESYESRLEPKYFVDDGLDAVWQPDVYPEAATLARRLGATRIVDVGCGTAAKLVALHPEFAIVGIDYGPNIAACRERYDVGEWIEVDLDSSETLGVESFEGSFLVCADVIEHLVHPERLLRQLRAALDAGAQGLLLSTPERDLNECPGHLGPPSNETHVREWTRDELQLFLASHGLHAHLGLTRSNDVMPYVRTILAAVPGSSPEDAAVMRDWFDERLKWQQLAVEQDRRIAELESWTVELQEARDYAAAQAEGQERLVNELRDWTQELETARDWLEEQRAYWQRVAEEAHAGAADSARDPAP